MNRTKTKLLAAISIIAVFVSLVVIAMPKPAQADQFDAQIAALKNQIQQNQDAANQKHGEADTLKNKIAQIQDQINAAVAALNLTKVQVSQTNQQIDDANKDLDRQKGILKNNLKILYKQGEISPLEVVASSKNLSDFVANQEYLGAIKKKVDENMAKIDQLQKELAAKKDQLVTLQTQQQGQADVITSQQNEQKQLLAQTQGDEAKYQQGAADNKKQLSAVYAQKAAQDAANHVGVSVGGSSYPWASPATFTTQADPWGFYLRQCVSYVAWKRRQMNKSPYPMYWGSAYQWMGYTNSSTPKEGAIAVWGQYVGGTGEDGHVAYVENVNSDGTMNLSEFNWRPYQYTYRTHVPATGLRFIY